MKGYLGYCVIDVDNDVHKIINVWKTEWEAKRAIIAWLLDGTLIEEDRKNVCYLWCPHISVLSGEFKSRVNNFIIYGDKDDLFQEKLFLKCTDIKLIYKLWNKLMRDSKDLDKDNFDCVVKKFDESNLSLCIERR